MARPTLLTTADLIPLTQHFRNGIASATKWGRGGCNRRPGNKFATRGNYGVKGRGFEPSQSEMVRGMVRGLLGGWSGDGQGDGQEVVRGMVRRWYQNTLLLGFLQPQEVGHLQKSYLTSIHRSSNLAVT